MELGLLINIFSVENRIETDHLSVCKNYFWKGIVYE
jgi:Somatostatin/Cortistatin family